MVEAVKRQYRSALRLAQARDTRRAIVVAASGLFVEKGYGATTIDAVAEAAGVSRKTVFTSVGGKVELLKLAMDWSIVGDDQPVALADRAEGKRLLELADPAALLAEWTTVLVRIDAALAALARALDIASDTDDAARSLRRQFLEQRLTGARLIVSRLVELKALRADLPIDQAVDIAWLYADPALYDRLVRERGWPTDQFAQWLSHTLTRQLLADQPKKAAASS